MFKTYNRSQWKNTTPKREAELFRLLANGGRSFTFLLKSLKWGSQTLTFYLDTLQGKSCIARKKHGRNVTYTLVKSNPYVQSLLKLPTPPTIDVRTFNLVKLDNLSEEAFINDWLATTKFTLLNIFRDYMLLGKKNVKKERKESLRCILQVEIEDIVNVICTYGQVLIRRIQENKIKPVKIREIRDRMQKEVINQLLQKHKPF